MVFGKFERAAFYKTLLLLRQRNVALSADASFRKVSVGDDRSVYAFVREKSGKKVLVILNFSGKPQSVAIKEKSLSGQAFNVFKSAKERLSNKAWELAPWGYAVYEYNSR